MKQTGASPDVLSRSVDLNNLRFCFKSREKRSNKGDYGRVLFVCGSYPDEDDGYAMSGAAALAARAAFRCGSGLVEICTHKGNFTTISQQLPEAIMLIYDGEINKENLISAIKNADAVVVGCGLGQSELARDILTVVLKNASSPLILDADALNLLSKQPRLWGLLGAEQRKRTVITPHIGEMSRLCGEAIEDILADPKKYAWEFSQDHNIITLLKDHKTVITNGEVMYVNTTGNPGMSTAGSGDVLSGILGSILGNAALGCDSLLERVAIGAYLHGLAGDISRDMLGEHSLIASDIVDNIPAALNLVNKNRGESYGKLEE